VESSRGAFVFRDQRLRIFDSNRPGEIEPGDTLHLNNVVCREGGIFFSGARLGTLFVLRGESVEPYAEIPIGTHNPRPYQAVCC